MATIIHKPKTTISPDILDDIQSVTQEMGQVVIHCILQNETSEECYMRIWPTTYIYDKHSPHNSELVHAENISLFPIWQEMKKGDNTFTLIFSGLPSSCTQFDLIEDCQGSTGAFKVLNISRNNSDVYFIQI